MVISAASTAAAARDSCRQWRISPSRLGRSLMSARADSNVARPVRKEGSNLLYAGQREICCSSVAGPHEKRVALVKSLASSGFCIHTMFAEGPSAFVCSRASR